MISLTRRFELPLDRRVSRPRDLEVDAQGNLYLLDSGQPTDIFKYDSTGQLLFGFDERDPQQERLTSVVEFSLAPWNTILVVNSGENALQTFLTRGLFASSVESSSGIILDVHPLPEFGSFYLHKWVPEQRRSVVLLMQAPDDSLATTYEVRIPSDLSVRRQARGVHFQTTVDGHGRLYVAFYDGYPVRVLSPNGGQVRVVDLDREPILKSPEDIAAETEENLERLREELPGVDPSLILEAAEPDSFQPLIEEMLVDPSTRLWIRTHRPDAVETTPYDVFNEAGEYLARVDVPGRVRRTAFRPDGRLFVLTGGEGEDPAVIHGYDIRFGTTGG